MSESDPPPSIADSGGRDVYCLSSEQLDRIYRAACQYAEHAPDEASQAVGIDVARLIHQRIIEADRDPDVHE